MLRYPLRGMAVGASARMHAWVDASNKRKNIHPFGAACKIVCLHELKILSDERGRDEAAGRVGLPRLESRRKS